MYKFQYSLSEQDYLEYNIYHAFNSPSGKKNMLIFRFVVPIIFIICGAVAGMLVEDAVITYICYIVFGFTTLYWLVFFKRLMTRQIKSNIVKIKKNGKLPYQSNVTLTFEDDCFTEATENGESKVKYSVIERVVTNAEVIYIYINAVQATLLPFTVFDDEKSRNELIAFIETKRTESDKEVS